MRVIRLVCWNAALALERAAQLEAAGFAVDASPIETSRVIGHFRETSPAVALIDLDRLPSHGREVAAALRSSKSTRGIPIVFAGGLDEKIDRIRRELPDAIFSPWRRVAPALRKALKGAPADPVRPVRDIDRYAASPLVKKLGFRPNTHASLIAAPEGFAEKLTTLPDGVTIEKGITRATALALWFVRARQELDRETAYLAARLPRDASLWIIHPKRTGRYKVDFNQNDVRAAGLAAGLVDYKVCAVDNDWSGLKFARKKK